MDTTYSMKTKGKTLRPTGTLMAVELSSYLSCRMPCLRSRYNGPRPSWGMVEMKLSSHFSHQILSLLFQRRQLGTTTFTSHFCRSKKPPEKLDL